MKAFLEQAFGKRITDDDLESAIRTANRRRKLLMEIIGFAGHTPPPASSITLKTFSASPVFPTIQPMSFLHFAPS